MNVDLGTTVGLSVRSALKQQQVGAIRFWLDQHSCMCFVLGVTSIDPTEHQLLFGRFGSGERREPPDIDVDFGHERRGKIIRWIHETYGCDRAALGLPEDLTSSLAKVQSAAPHRPLHT